ncbi:hypothetical protein PR202_ga19292 [Eleusine coracana subsp. coracana]|uniref:Transcription repressor n=1 Tax=Eleusine coracana subsp. coracana TaxID=191504 RepID=A0AAV5CV72_ELECO|nr:hypothetical protein PR202_ga19292 [Eleusine coracana subsp. coracana]
MSPAAAKKRLGVGGGGFGLGCGCKDAKAVAVAAASSASPYSTEASTATSATWRRVAAAHPSASGSTGTLTVPSASSSSFFPWEDADDGEEVNCGKRESTTSFSGLLKQLNELEQSVVTLGARKSTSKQSDLSPPPPPPPPPPLPSRPIVKQRAVHSSGDRHDKKEGHGDFSPPPPAPSSQFQTQQQHGKAKTMMDKGERQELAALFRQPPPPSSSPSLPPEQPRNPKVTVTEKGSKQKEDVNESFPPQPQKQQQPQPQQHRKAKSLDGGVRLDGTTVAVVKQSADPLGDFRRSMANMVVENRIATGDDLRELLRHFLALNAPHHHDAILRAFTEIWDQAFSTTTNKQQAHAQQPQHREPSSGARPTPPRQRPLPTTTPQQRRPRHTARVWR